MSPRHDSPRGRLGRALGLFHTHFFKLLLASYAVAAFWPAPGLRIRDLSIGRVAVLGESTRLSLPMMMLALLLLNAGIGVRLADLRALVLRPKLLVLGLLANLAVPIGFIVVVSQVMGHWHNHDELQNILVGLALVASMPIAGSSTAWAQNADGDLPLSLGLVVASTILSPLATPLALHAVGFLATGGYATELHALARNGTGGFLAVCVVVPSVMGIGLRCLIGERIYRGMRPWLKLASAVDLLVLCYSNAAVALPQAIAQPDWDFLFAIVAITAGLCACAFLAGSVLGRLSGAEESKRVALMYGLGMNNNGTGLVLASMSLANHPLVMLPIIFYNLVQQIVAGGVGSRRITGDTEGRRGAERPCAALAGLGGGSGGGRRYHECVGQRRRLAETGR